MMVRQCASSVGIGRTELDLWCRLVQQEFGVLCNLPPSSSLILASSLSSSSTSMMSTTELLGMNAPLLAQNRKLATQVKETIVATNDSSSARSRRDDVDVVARNSAEDDRCDDDELRVSSSLSQQQSPPEKWDKSHTPEKMILSWLVYSWSTKSFKVRKNYSHLRGLVIIWKWFLPAGTILTPDMSHKSLRDLVNIGVAAMMKAYDSLLLNRIQKKRSSPAISTVSERFRKAVSFVHGKPGDHGDVDRLFDYTRVQVRELFPKPPLHDIVDLINDQNAMEKSKLRHPWTAVYPGDD